MIAAEAWAPPGVCTSARSVRLNQVSYKLKLQNLSRCSFIYYTSFSCSFSFAYVIELTWWSHVLDAVTSHH